MGAFFLGHPLVPSTMMLDAYLVDLLALKEVETDRQTDILTDRRTIAFLELFSQLKKENGIKDTKSRKLNSRK